MTTDSRAELDEQIRAVFSDEETSHTVATFVRRVLDLMGSREADIKRVLLEMQKEMSSNYSTVAVHQSSSASQWAADEATVAYDAANPESAELLDAMQAFIRAEVSETDFLMSARLEQSPGHGLVELDKRDSHDD